MSYRMAIGRGMVLVALAAMPISAVRAGVTERAAASSSAPVPTLVQAGDATWEELPPLPEPRSLHAVASDPAGRIYVFGGTGNSLASVGSDQVFRYDPESGNWSELGRLPRRIVAGAAARLGDRIYLPGDAAGGDTLVFDVPSGDWISIPANSGYSARSEYAVVARPGRLVVLGGVLEATGLATREVWVLDVNTGQWSASIPMNSPRISFSAGLLDDEIVVSGGVDFPGFEPVISTEIFNGQSWRFGRNLPLGDGLFSRWSYNASASDGERLWLAGGRRDGGWNVLGHSGWYELRSDQWQTTPALPGLNQPRAYPRGVITPDGFFHVLGGRSATASLVFDSHERLRIRPVAQLEIGGSVLGLLGQGMAVREVVSGQLLPISPADPNYRFVLGDGSDYELALASLPVGPMQNCQIAAPSGQLDGNPILDLDLQCRTRRFPVGGTVTALTGPGLELVEQVQGLRQAISGGTNEYDFMLEDGSPYRIVVAAQPNGQYCQISNPIGRVEGSGMDIVSVNCFPIDIAFEPGNLDLGPVALGESIRSRLQISNPGSIDLRLRSLDGLVSPFTLSGGDCLPLERILRPGERCDLEFSMLGIERGEFQAELSLESTSGSSPNPLLIRGVVVGPSLLVPIDDRLSLLLLAGLILLLGLFSFRGRALQKPTARS